MDTAETKIKSPSGHRGIVEIAFLFKNAQCGFTDPEVRRPEDQRTNTRRLLNRLCRLTDPLSLLLISGGAKIFVFLQPAMRPSMGP